MPGQNTSINVIITSLDDEDFAKTSCESALKLEINDKDNLDSSYFPGSSCKFRLYVGSKVEDIKIFSNKGTIALVEENVITSVGDEEDVYANFSGENYFQLGYKYVQNFSYEAIGSVNDLSGNVLDSVVVSPQENLIKSSAYIYAIFKIEYETSYDSYSISIPDYGEYLITAIGTCKGETVSSSVSLSVSKSDTTEEGSEDLSIEILEEDQPSDFVSSYFIGENYTARVYKSSDVSGVNGFNTLGRIQLTESDIIQSIGAKSEKLYISFNGENTTSIPYKYVNNLVYLPVGTFYTLNGSPTSTPELVLLEKTASISFKAFGVFEISYNTSYDKYSFSGDSDGEAIIGVAGTSANGNAMEDSANITFETIESSSCSSVSSSVSSSEALLFTDVILVFKDFISGIELPNTTVYLNDVRKGVTDDFGKILITGVEVNKIQNIKAEKEGYLSTDSDSFSNDQFIINV